MFLICYSKITKRAGRKGDKAEPTCSPAKPIKKEVKWTSFVIVLF